MGKRGDRLHLDCVHLLELVVEHPRGVDYLVAEVLVLGVADVERLGGEGVGLDLDVGLADAVDETRLPHVGIPRQENGPLVGVNRWQPTHMLPHLLQVPQRRADLPDHGTHPPQGVLDHQL